MKKILFLSTLVALAAIPARADFGAGDLAVLQVGDSAETLASSGNSVFIDDYSTAGQLMASFAVPDTGSSALLISGSAASEGALSLSPNGTTLAFAGYNASLPRSGSLANASSASVPRGFGSMNAAGQFTLQGITTTQFSSNNVRSAVTDGHNNYWVGGAVSGTFYGGFTTTTGTVQSATANTSVTSIQNGNLYFSTSKGTAGIYGFTGTPTGAATPTLLITSDESKASPDAFAFNSAGTIAYVADDNTIAKGGGVQRYDLVSGVWTYDYTLNPEGPSGTVGAHGLVVDFSGTDPVIYGTTTEASQNELFKIVDAGSTSSGTEVAVAPAGAVFDGVADAPQNAPEPGTLALLGLGAAALLIRRRAQK